MAAKQSLQRAINKRPDQSTEILLKVGAKWISQLLNSDPSWKEWKIESIHKTLFFDEPELLGAHEIKKEFHFSDEVEKQHAVVSQFFGLKERATSLRECEYYF